MTTTYSAHRSNSRTFSFSAFYAALRSLGGNPAAAEQDDVSHEADDETSSSPSTLLPKWDVAEFLADSRAAQAMARQRRVSRRKAMDVDPQAMARAERMVASIHARSVVA